MFLNNKMKIERRKKEFIVIQHSLMQYDIKYVPLKSYYKNLNT